jgi:hypothetical protein
MSLMDTLHAPFPPSQPSWLNYTDEQLIEALKNKYNVMSVPCLIINDETVSFGKKTIGELLHLISA